MHYVDPLYPLQYLTTNWFPSCLGYLFQITFVAVLLLVWLCIFHGIRIVSKNLIVLLSFITEFILLNLSMCNNPLSNKYMN